jgi:hypothetical protein
MKVSFLIVGAQKGGTTALDTYLRPHPQICMAERKEAHYFDEDSLFSSNGRLMDHTSYHALFNPKREKRVLGEATPIYMYWWEAPKRIWQYNPQMKLIALLRDPIDRAYSHWNMEHARKADMLPFGEAIRSEVVRRRERLPSQHRVFSYVDRGFYLEQLRRLWAFFPRDQVLVLKSDDLQRNPADTLRQVHEFIGVECQHPEQMEKVHVGSYIAPMDDSDRAYLRTIYEYEIRSLERALGWDCSGWLAT